MTQLLYKIDHVLASGKGRQLLWLFVFILIVFITSWGISLLFGYHLSFAEIMTLLLSPGSFPMEGHLTFQIVVMLIGLILVSSLLISVIDNVIEGRADAFNAGTTRYRYRKHILFLGADEMLSDTIAGLDVNDRSKIVILTTCDAVEVRRRIFSEISNPLLTKRVVVLYGERTKAEELQSVYASDASKVYILGESNETDRDTKNIHVVELLEHLCSNRSQRLETVMLYSEMSTMRIMQLTDKCVEHLSLTLVNTNENWAQRIFVSGIQPNGEAYPKLYRKPIEADDPHHVHVVIAGFSRTTNAVTATIAHLAHYPNFITKGVRTCITIVSPHASQQYKFVCSHFDGLSQVIRRRFYTSDELTLHLVDSYTPEAEYDFMDLELEFIESTINHPQLREQMTQWQEDKNQFLTLVIADDDTEQNLIDALSLPKFILGSDIPVWVYQNRDSAMVDWTNRYTCNNNIYPFGMRQNCFDPTFSERWRLAHLTNDIYECHAKEWYPQRQPKTWEDLRISLQMSNLYHANYCYAVLSQVDPKYYAQLEHNRWNMERLLVGNRVLPKALRERVEKSQGIEREQLMEHYSHLRYHHNIAPFSELNPTSVEKDEAITHELIDKIKF